MSDDTSTAPASTASSAAASSAPEPEPASGHSTPSARPSTFGPSALLTPANGITALRLLATPLMIVLIMVRGADWINFVVWGALSLTDGIDGWVARRQGTTRSGAFLDPLADKVVVLGALFALVAKSIVWWPPVVIIAVREVYMSVYRSVVGRKGVSIPARTTAKAKTLLQSVAVALCLVPPLARHHSVLVVAIWAAAILTVFTGGQYYLDGRKPVPPAHTHPMEPRDGD
jgi:CDP-diacylglycerol--glycerol-3-phosphate 3-phosphatidyltransferase